MILAWLRFVNILAVSPFIGIIFHMFFHVLLIILMFLAIFSPILLGYAICFWKMLNTRDVVEKNFFNSIIKVLFLRIKLFHLSYNIFQIRLLE